MYIISYSYVYCLYKLGFSNYPSILNPEYKLDMDYVHSDALNYLNNNKIIIDVIGNSKSGKSTLQNHLIG
jgi:hypothetical protein